MRNVLKNIPTLLLCISLLFSMSVAAQNKTTKKVAKPAAKVKEDAQKVVKEDAVPLYEGVIVCKTMKKRDAGNEASMVQSGNKKIAKADKDAVSSQNLVLDYSAGKFIYKGITGTISRKDKTVKLTLQRDNDVISGMMPICELSDEILCELSSKYADISNNSENLEVGEKLVGIYSRTNETKEIAGVKCVLYFMNLQNSAYPIWVDENQTTNGMMWPYIGMTHPVLAGVFFLPVHDMEMTMIEFEAVSEDKKGDKEPELKITAEVPSNEIEGEVLNYIMKNTK